VVPELPLLLLLAVITTVRRLFSSSADTNPFKNAPFWLVLVAVMWNPCWRKPS